MLRKEGWRRFRKSNRTWDSPWLPALAALGGGILAALALRPAGAGLVWTFLFGALAMGFPALLVRYACARVIRELRATVNVRPLTGSRLVSTDPWAVDAVFAERLLTLLDEGPGQVVECGSGRSTVLIARRLEDEGSGHVTALEHLPRFANRTRCWLRDAGLEHRATVLDAPLTEQEVDGRTVMWYDPEGVRKLPARIDLLVVDGPPCHVGRRARWPTVPALRDRLVSGTAIHMDDGDRKDERDIARDWGERLRVSPRYVPGGKGGWILRVP